MDPASTHAERAFPSQPAICCDSPDEGAPRPRRSKRRSIEALRDCKEVVVAELRRIAAAAGELRRSFERHVAFIMRMRNLLRPEAERLAFEAVLVDRLNAVFPDTRSDRCAHCGRPETLDAVLLLLGYGAFHSWLHADRRERWRNDRRAKAIAELASAGVIKPVSE
jgi:hypothetical protein